MMVGRWLRLYPRVWRERYGEEFVELLKQRPITLGTAIDIVSGAIDARLSSTARLARQSAGEGVAVMKALESWGQKDGQFTVTDGLIGAGIIIVSSILFLALASELQRHGLAGLATYVKAIAFPASVILAFPFTFLKGQPWRAQVAITGGTIALLVVIVLA